MKITRFHFIDGTFLDVGQNDLINIARGISTATKTISGKNYIVLLENVTYIENLEIE